MSQDERPADGHETTEQTIRAILREAKTIAVVGLSPDPSRPSHGVARYMQEQGYRIIPVNPAEREILGETCYATLSDIPFPVDVVDVFRRSEFVPPIAEDAVKIGAKALWLQLGVISPEGAETAKRGGLRVVMDRCLAIEHERFGG
ncbi:MAG TPA: CoA-binding protein [Ktedonobacterales bacterium]|nr:CoA-binding protein [Ktedonobacterales bacterium]